MGIEELDPRTAPDDVLAAAHQVVAEVEAEQTPDEPPPTLAELVAEWRHPPAFLEAPHWLATRAGEPVGLAFLELRDVPHNRAYAEFDIAVTPAARRQGVGTALLEAALHRAHGEGRPLTTGYALAGGAGWAFLERHGFTCRQVERRSRLRTAEVDRALLHGWVQRAAERAGNYSHVGRTGPSPDEHDEAYARESMVMNTAPLDEVEFEDMVITPDQVRAVQASFPDRGIEPWVLCAATTPVSSSPRPTSASRTTAPATPSRTTPASTPPTATGAWAAG